MRRVRVLIVDDAVGVRRLLSQMLASDPAIEIAGTAPNGRIALGKLDQLSPDVVVLDVEMPEMDGLETLKQMRTTHPNLPVIMFSSHTERGALATIDALALGASDYVTKPSNLAGGKALEEIREQLVRKVVCVASIDVLPERPPEIADPHKQLALPRVVPRLAPAPPAQVVVIGSSTGGPNALAEVLSALPADFPVPLLIVQHMPPLFTRLLAERLCATSSFLVSEACDGEEIGPGRAWVAPGDFHMTVKRGSSGVTVHTSQGPQVNSCRPSVDVLFHSVAEVFGARALAIVMTGMGHDGLAGAQAIFKKGGQIIVQDQASSVVWGMPGFVANAGIAERILPPHEMGEEIIRRVTSPGMKLRQMGEFWSRRNLTSP